MQKISCLNMTIRELNCPVEKWTKERKIEETPANERRNMLVGQQGKACFLIQQ